MSGRACRLWPQLVLAACSALPQAAAQSSRPAAPPPTSAPAAPPRELDRDAARAALDRTLAWLTGNQRADGGWGTAVIEGVLDSSFAIESYYAWQHAAHSVACLALLQAPRSAARDASLERALDWLLRARMPQRGSEWDNDALWPHLYGLVACVGALQDPRHAHGERRAPLERNARAHLGWLEHNQTPTGGFGYYDDPPFSRRPKWATSFSTALVLPALAFCQEAGWLADPRSLERAAEYVRRCRLPSGAYQYDLNPVPRHHGGEDVDHVKGSLGRIQVCNWALRESGDPRITDDVIRAGVARFFEHHEFLQVARLRPVPHEAYYQNAGYFYFFGHYYAALAIGQLPAAEREAWHRQLRAAIVPALRADGSTADFLPQSYLITAATAFAALALSAGLEPAGG